jgi:hypothetical protein
MARNRTFDFVKGAVVIAMAAHHSINYFVSPYLSTKYVHFVSGAFPFLAGFLVTNLIIGRGNQRDSRRLVSRRMVFRGARLIVLCGVLNAFLASSFGHLAKFGRIAGSGYSEYLTKLLWNGNYREVSFSLLIPIGYVLVTLGVFNLCHMLGRFVLWTLTALLILYCVGADFGLSKPVYYAGYFTMGILGAALGLIPQATVERFCRKTWLVVAIYLVTLCGVVVLGLPFSIFALNVVTTLLLLYSLGLLLPLDKWYLAQILLLGRYSLFMYLAQIVILFLLRFVFYYYLPEAANALCGFIGVCMAQVVVCWIMERIRARSRIVDRAYVALFA